jgi:hypothetical protein
MPFAFAAQPRLRYAVFTVAESAIFRTSETSYRRGNTQSDRTTVVAGDDGSLDHRRFKN